MKKKLLALIIAAIMLLGLTSCGRSEGVEGPPETLLLETNIAELAENPQPTDDPDAIGGDGIELTFMGRASVRLDFDDGRVMYIDPAYGNNDEYQKEADIILVTHQHEDHNNVGLVTLKEDGIKLTFPSNISSGNPRDIDGITVTAVDAYNDYHSKSNSCGFIIEYKDIVIYHSGDTSTTEQMTEFPLYNIDYALLCMDGYYNMGPAEAMEVAELINVQAVIPIHTAASGSFSVTNAMEFTLDSRLYVDRGETIELYNISETNGVNVPLDEAILDIMVNRLISLQTEDYNLYMDSIGLNNQFYFNEQERWFMNMIEDKISNITFEIKSVEMIDEKLGVVNIHQQHDMDVHYSFDYPLLFKYEDGQWMDYGYNFEEIKTDRFIVKYMKGEDRLDEFVQMLDEAFDNLDELYELKPLPDYEMKLFTNQEMLRQRCIPANSWLFTGWSEPDESIKLYTGQGYAYEGYQSVVQHELVHHITIRMCNNNLPVWLLEGIAMYDGSAYYGVNVSRMLTTMTKSRVSQTIEELETNNLNTDLTTQEIYNYYSTSYMYVRYIIETYGRDKLIEIFTVAGQKPFHDSTLNDEFYVINQQTASEVILEVLGITKTRLSNDYLNWVKAFDFENLQ